MEEIKTKPLTKQKLWEMAKVITAKQKLATKTPKNKINWEMLEDLWFDWLEQELTETNN